MDETLLKIAELVGRSLTPSLRAISGNDGDVRLLLLKLGYSTPTPPPSIASISLAANALLSALNELELARDLAAANLPGGDVSGALAKTFAGCGAVALAVAAVGNAAQAALPGFEDRFYGYIFATALERELPIAFAALAVLGITEVEQTTVTNSDGTTLNVFRRKFSTDRVSQFFTSPKQLMAELYGWGTSTLNTKHLFDNVSRLSTLLGPVPLREYPTEEQAAAYGTNLSANDLALARRLTIPIGALGASDVTVDFYPVPVSSPGAAQGLAVTINAAAAGKTIIPLTNALELDITTSGSIAEGLGIVLRPDQPPQFLTGIFSGSALSFAGGSAEIALSFSVDPEDSGGLEPSQGLVSVAGGSTLSATKFGGFLRATKNTTTTDVAIGFKIDKGTVHVGFGGADGFVGGTLPRQGLDASFAAEVVWSKQGGLRFSASGSLEIRVPIGATLGPATLDALTLRVDLGNRLGLSLLADVRVALGPVTTAIQGMGASLGLEFTRGNIGAFNASGGFVAPTGLGISLDTGSVTGGGFLSVKDGTYSGALALKVYGVNVQAFGVLETKLPNGQSGYSFVIVISAEFTPIQLGLGFTLNGVGGIIGINRSIDQDALGKGVRTGALERLLFPHDVVHDAPQIIHDLQAILPPTDDHYVFGPLAKIGWGTPTIIEAEIGIILEFPGPRLALLGEVSALLPKKDKGIITLNLSVAGLLDFPKKYFAIDASLHDSKIGSYPISGDMAMRMSWGDNPTFALAVGGFNPAFQPPAGFPKLRRVTVDLGVSGNPSVTLQGYFALTSNTAQFGALAELRANGAGIDIYARLQFDALIVFSPFAFEIAIAAQVSVSFHGHGITAHLDGLLRGPSPWHVHGHVCVSILWWDACHTFDKDLSGGETVELPSLDPWAGSPVVNGVQDVVGLLGALQDVRNWTPEPPPAVFTVVSFADNTTSNQLFDPLGVAVVKESVCPFNLKLQRFGSAKAAGTPTFTLQKATFDGVLVTGFQFKKEPFARGQFVQLTDAQKLSAPSFEPFDGAIRLPANDNKTRTGSSAGTDLSYHTKVLGDPTFVEHPLPVEHQLGMTRRSAAGLFGLRRSAAQAYLDPTALARFTVGNEEFVIGNKSTLTTQPGVLTTPANKAEAIAALNAHFVTNPEDRDVLQVYPKFELGGR